MGCGVSKNANAMVVGTTGSDVPPARKVEDEAPLSPKANTNTGPPMGEKSPSLPKAASPLPQTPQQGVVEDKENLKPAAPASPPAKKPESPALAVAAMPVPNEAKAKQSSEAPATDMGKLPEGVTEAKPAPSPVAQPAAEAKTNGSGEKAKHSDEAGGKGKAPEGQHGKPAVPEIHTAVEVGESSSKAGAETPSDVSKLPPLDGRSKLPPLSRSTSLQKAEGKDPFAKAALPLHPPALGVGTAEEEEGADEPGGVTVQLLQKEGGEVEVAITPKAARHKHDFSNDGVSVELTPRAGGGVDVLISPKGHARPKNIFADGGPDSTPRSATSPGWGGSDGPLSPSLKAPAGGFGSGGPWGYDEDEELQVEMRAGEGGSVSVAISPKGPRGKGAAGLSQERPHVDSPDPDDVVPFLHHKLPFAAHVLEADASGASTPRSETGDILKELMKDVEGAHEAVTPEPKVRQPTRFAAHVTPSVDSPKSDPGSNPPPSNPEEALRGTWKDSEQVVTVVVGEEGGGGSLLAVVSGAVQGELAMETRTAWVMKGSSKTDELKFMVALTPDTASFLGFYTDASKPQEGHLWVSEPREIGLGTSPFVGKWSVRDVGEDLSIVMDLAHNEGGAECREGCFMIPGEEGSVAVIGTVSHTVVAFGRWTGESEGRTTQHDAMMFMDDERAKLRLWMVNRDGNSALGHLHTLYSQS